MFSALTTPNYPNSALGIEENRITAVSLQGQGRGSFAIRQAATVDLPTGLVKPNFLEKNISNGFEFSSYLREAAESAGMLSQKRWSVALPSGTARTAILVLDSEPASRQEAEEVLNWKAEQNFGAPASALRLAKEKISPDASGRSRYFATAVTLSVIDEYETQFEGLGWKAGLILPRAVGEANWLADNSDKTDSLLISTTNDGFTGLLLRSGEPAVVRSVTCTSNEIDDEIYRLLMFYNDRFGGENGNSLLQKLLVIGKDLMPGKVQTIASEALGRALNVLSPEDVGLSLPGGGLQFDDLAAPAGLAALGFR
ncbi:MAG: hypothetical protein IPL32_01840 [Chloracidobacterium sp.]|nr:hypothetical protein [Chloracidobacterium sp.]